MSERHTQNGSSHEGDRFPEELLTAYALGQLEGAERGGIERMLANPVQEDARRIVAETQRLASELPTSIEACGVEPGATSSAAFRAAVDERLSLDVIEKPELPASRRPWYRLTLLEAGAVVSLCLLLVAMFLPGVQSARESSRQIASGNTLKQLDGQFHRDSGAIQPDTTSPQLAEDDGNRYQDLPLATLTQPGEGNPADPKEQWFDQQGQPISRSDKTVAATGSTINGVEYEREKASPAITGYVPHIDMSGGGSIGAGGMPRPGGPAHLVQSAGQGQPGHGQPDSSDPQMSLINGQSTYQNFYRDPKAGDSVRMLVTPRIVVQEEETDRLAAVTELDKLAKGRDVVVAQSVVRGHHFQLDAFGSEQYEPIHENVFLAPRQSPLSTFSIDVDTASYANMRRFLTGGSLPPPNAVRIEELVNYFRYDYPQPKGPEPFSVNMEVAECPWAESHLLLRVGLKGKDVHRGERPASNLVFLLDVSGSMADENKLPLLKTALQMFTRELGENDRVSIVTYAGEAGLRLPPTRGHEQQKILAAIESLSSGGSTNGSAGIDLAYEQAKAYFVEGGTNRVILCTDGDLNVGITDDEALVQLIKQRAGGGTFLTVLGFGEGNLQDAKMEKLADNGNGLYAYIDSVREARKVLVEQMTGSTITIAKDVKIQIEFNPAVIASYRLLGYENRVLAAQDFNDDKKDAGEIGAGHTVTALYELVPVGAKPEAAVPAGVEPLKYQQVEDKVQSTEDRGQEPGKLTDAAKSGELLTLKLRYKEPAGQESKLFEFPLKDRGGKFNGASKDLQFAAAVASFGMILRGSEHKGSSNIAAVEEIASGAIGEDAGGYRAEFVDLVRKASSLGAR